MNILFDYQTFSNQNYGGISRYFANLNTGLNNSPGVSAKLGMLFTRNAYIDKNDLPLNGLLNGIVGKRSRRDKYNKWYSNHLLQKNSFDVFHPTYYNPYFLKQLKKPFVLTVHDMIHELFPHYFEKVDPLTAGYKKQLITRADHIIAISESTKADIQQFYAIADSKITVVHHGYQMQPENDINDVTVPHTNYLLYVGDRFGYKNFGVFLNAVSAILIKYNINLICTGGGAFNAEESDWLKRYQIIDRTQQVTVTDQGLKQLYANALAFIYPSLYEGFGLPVLEAFSNNCPVIMSNKSSLPEVGGDAAIYFDPANGQSIAHAIEQLLDNITLQNELKAKGHERLKQFSFEQCLNHTINVYKLLA